MYPLKCFGREKNNMTQVIICLNCLAYEESLSMLVTYEKVEIMVNCSLLYFPFKGKCMFGHGEMPQVLY